MNGRLFYAWQIILSHKNDNNTQLRTVLWNRLWTSGNVSRTRMPTTIYFILLDTLRSTNKIFLTLKCVRQRQNANWMPKYLKHATWWHHIFLFIVKLHKKLKKGCKNWDFFWFYAFNGAWNVKSKTYIGLHTIQFKCFRTILKQSH